MAEVAASTRFARTLVGRDLERTRLAAACDRAASGQGGLVVVTGPAGIGKSRLAAAAVEDGSARGLAVLRGRAVPSATAAAFRPFAEALSSVVRSGVAPAPGALAAYRSVIGRILPDWHDEGERPVDESVLGLAEGVVRFLAATGRGCVLVLEDLHWSDPESLEVLEYLADHVTSVPVLVLATVRTDEPSPAAEVIDRLADRRAAERLSLGPLTDADVRRMVAECLDYEAVPQDVVSLAARADGVPFLVEELLNGARQAGSIVRGGEGWAAVAPLDPVVPRSFAEVVRRRMDQLPSDERRVVRTAAVLGRVFPLELLAPATGLDPGSVVGALEAATDAGLFSTEAGRELRFRHALTRDAVLHQLFPPERAGLAAEALAAVGLIHPDLEGEWCDLAAGLAIEAGDDQRAAELCLDLARRAIDRGGLVSARLDLERAERAARHGGTGLLDDVQEALTQVASLGGDGSGAGEELLDRIASVPSESARRARVHLLLGRTAVGATRWDQARRHLEAAVAEPALADDPELACRHLSLEAAVALGMDDRAAAEVAATEARQLAHDHRWWDVVCESEEVIGRCRRPVDLDGAEQAFRRSYDTASEHDLSVWRVRALHELGTVELLRAGRLDGLRRARDLAVELGAFTVVADVGIQMCGVLATGDDPEELCDTARLAASVARRYGMDQTQAVALGFEAMGHGRRRRRREMEACLSEAAVLAGSDPSAPVIASSARLLLAFAEEDRAGQLVQVAGEDLRHQGPFVGWWSLLHALGPDGDARVSDALGWGEPVHFIGRAYLAYAEAIVAGRSGDDRRALDRLAAGDEVLTDQAWCRQLGRRLVAEAAVAGGWGEPVPWLRDAESFFHDRGEEPNASACRSLLRLAGAPVRRRRPDPEEASVPGSLSALGVTARELEVLGLVAEGLPNRTIAERLFLSPRTVERHVANLVVKVGVERRAELVAWAARTLG